VFPRFVNGNPVTGTEGSIPPATAFDEDQIEIVTVIQNAGLTPDHADLTQLWQALMALFAQKYITTHITKTVHGVGADFPDLNAAMNWLAQFIITPSGFVTFQLPAGQFYYTTSIEINHPNSNRIEIQGVTLTGSPGQSVITVTGFATAGDKNAQLAQMRGYWRTELIFQNGITGFRVYRGGCTLHYLLIWAQTPTVSAPVGGDPGGCGIAVFDEIIFDGIGIHGFGNCGVYMVTGAVLSYTSLSTVIASCGSSGFWTYSGLVKFPATQNVITVSNGVAGWTCFGSEVYAGIADVRGHNAPVGTNNGAVQVEQGTQFIASHGSLIYFNNNIGVTIADSSTCQVSGCNITGNTNFQIWMNNGVCWAEGSAVTQGSYGSAWAIRMQNGAQCSVVGGSIGGNCYPTPDTYGQADNSYTRFHT
jgi:hypothetical protein